MGSVGATPSWPTKGIMEQDNVRYLQRLADGTFIDWGRHVTVNGKRGTGGAVWYHGEAAKVMALVLKYTENKTNDSTSSETTR